MVKRINLLKISLICCLIAIFVLTGCSSKSDDSNFSSSLTNDMFEINQPKDITVLSVDWSIDSDSYESVKLVYEWNNERYYIVFNEYNTELSSINLIVPNDKIRLTLKSVNKNIFDSQEWDVVILK